MNNRSDELNPLLRWGLINKKENVMARSYKKPFTKFGAVKAGTIKAWKQAYNQSFRSQFKQSLHVAVVQDTLDELVVVSTYKYGDRPYDGRMYEGTAIATRK